MKKEMLINVLQPEECRIAILEDGILEELYVERTSHESYVGNIYKGRIVNIEPSIQAAFVDFGVGRNGFLHVSDVEPTYYRHLEQRRGDRGDRGERGGGRRGGRDRGRDQGRDQGRRQPVIYEDDDLDRFPGADFGSLDPLEEQEANASVTFTEETYTETVEPTEAVEQVEPIDSREDEALAAPESGLHEEVAEQPEIVEEAPEALEAPEASEAASEEPEEPLTAHPETRLEEESGKGGRRRSRGGSRRRRSSDKTKSEESASAEEPPAGGDAEPHEPPPGPRLMDSAERRTTEKEDGPQRPHEISSSSGSADDDDLLFFPRPAPSSTPTPPPAPEPEPEEPEPEAAWTPPPPPPPRARPSQPSWGNIEDELEADLAAAEVNDTAFTAFTEPAEGPGEVPVEPDFDDNIPPRRPPRERGRDRDRDRDRGREGRSGFREEGRGRRERDPRDEGGRGGRRNGNGGRRGGGRGGRPGAGRDKPLIQDIFKRGQEVIVQVIKEGIGTKGPTLSTYISIAGRYLVLMPGLNRVGVSRKIADDEQRHRLREIFHELKPPRGLGFIIRTAGMDKDKKELQRDLLYLSRLWQVVVRRIRKIKGPAEIYQESDMITRTLRDTFTNDIDTIWVDEPAAFEHAREFLQFVMPRFADRIRHYDATEPLFHKYGIEEEIARIQQRKVPLPHGGSIVIEQTEALVAIDVNSGNFRADNNAEETAYQMNLQAAREIARQLRLRDLGGVIVNDFIDMRDEKHRRGVEKAMRDAVQRDRARTKILKISPFGLIEMTRQRIRPSLKRSVYQDCPYCHGMAQVKTCESMSIDVMRMLQLAAHREAISRVEVRVAADVADYLLNKKRHEITRLEQSGEIQVHINGVAGAPPETLDLVCLDNNGNEVKLFPQETPTRRLPSHR